MDATIGDTTNTMWMFAGTGDYERINDTTSGVQNYMLGIKDRDYPLYKEVATPAKQMILQNVKIPQTIQQVEVVHKMLTKVGILL